jgi:hypothetical protein
MNRYKQKSADHRAKRAATSEIGREESSVPRNAGRRESGWRGAL